MQIRMPTERSRDFVTVDLNGAACLAATLAPPPLPLEVYRSAFGEDEQRDKEDDGHCKVAVASLHCIHSIHKDGLYPRGTHQQRVDSATTLAFRSVVRACRQCTADVRMGGNNINMPLTLARTFSGMIDSAYLVDLVLASRISLPRRSISALQQRGRTCGCLRQVPAATFQSAQSGFHG